MVCSICGNEIKPGDKFCMACGTSVAAMNTANAAPEAPQPAPQPVPVQPQPILQEQPVQTMYVPLDANGQPIGGPVQTMYVPVDANGQPIFAQPVPGQQPLYAQPMPGQQPMYAQPAYAQPTPYAVPMAAESAGKPVLILGIISLVLALSGAFSAGGIICGAIAMSKATGIEKQFGALSNQAKTGKGLGKAGFITGIVITGFIVLVLGIVFIAYLVDEVF